MAIYFTILAECTNVRKRYTNGENICLSQYSIASHRKKTNSNNSNVHDYCKLTCRQNNVSYGNTDLRFAVHYATTNKKLKHTATAEIARDVDDVYFTLFTVTEDHPLL